MLPDSSFAFPLLQAALLHLAGRRTVTSWHNPQVKVIPWSEPVGERSAGFQTC
jgi:hypothetical protein